MKGRIRKDQWVLKQAETKLTNKTVRAITHKLRQQGKIIS